MPAVIQTTALNAGDGVKLMVTESYDEVMERLRSPVATAGGLVEVTLERGGQRVAVNPAQIVFVREPLG
ncbi:hypothetical protein [Conexibacter arvalis]|uniref:Uncharacterized protein n=1 Tax=Conexibacter arvalis TaxID=912552 RepID=A0A840I8G9_9ACTN|nr:hypothetical protein [Conexibacter arvalis]MBB4660822.1 hypothetical protein [Conexibacter arvalis]